MHGPKQLGDDAEERAAVHLIESGFTIVTRNFHARSGEIDIVALEGDQLVFVEVKLRRSSLPEEAITASKAARMRRVANEYIRMMDELRRGYRFDLIAIDGDGLRHYRNVCSAEV